MQGLVVGFVMLFLVAPVALTVRLAPRGSCFAPAAVLGVLGIAVLSSSSPDRHGDAMGALGDAAVAIAGVSMLGFALVCVIVGAILCRVAPQPAPEP